MKRNLFVTMLIATLVAAVAAAISAPAAQAQTVPGTTCTVGTQTVPCTLELVGFAGGGGNLRAIFELTNELTGQVTRVLVPISQVQQGPNTCTILDLTIQPIDLFLLGLHLHTDTIHVTLTAERGTLLGDLLCGLFFGNPNAGLLNRILGSSGAVITTTP